MVREGGVVLTLFTKPKWRVGGGGAVVASRGVGGGGMVVKVGFVKGGSGTERKEVVVLIVSFARTKVLVIQTEKMQRRKDSFFLAD